MLFQRNDPRPKLYLNKVACWEQISSIPTIPFLKGGAVCWSTGDWKHFTSFVFWSFGNWSKRGEATRSGWTDGRRDLDSLKISKLTQAEGRQRSPALALWFDRNTNHTDNQELIFTQVNRFLVIPRTIDGKEATASANSISVTRWSGWHI